MALIDLMSEHVTMCQNKSLPAFINCLPLNPNFTLILTKKMQLKSKLKS